MENLKMFIYVNNGEYFEKTIILDKSSVRTSDVFFQFSNSKKMENFKRKYEMKKRMSEIVNQNDVIMSTSDFGNYSIVTTGGVIITDTISNRVRKTAVRKRNLRREALDSFFLNKIYSRARADEYMENKEIIEELLELQKMFLTGKTSANTDDYKLLLDCLVEAPEPVKSKDYDERVKLLFKEYSID